MISFKYFAYFLYHLFNAVPRFINSILYNINELLIIDIKIISSDNFSISTWLLFSFTNIKVNFLKFKILIPFNQTILHKMSQESIQISNNYLHSIYQNVIRYPLRKFLRYQIFYIFVHCFPDDCVKNNNLLIFIEGTSDDSNQLMKSVHFLISTGYLWG